MGAHWNLGETLPYKKTEIEANMHISIKAVSPNSQECGKTDMSRAGSITAERVKLQDDVQASSNVFGASARDNSHSM